MIAVEHGIFYTDLWVVDCFHPHQARLSEAMDFSSRDESHTGHGAIRSRFSQSEQIMLEVFQNVETPAREISLVIKCCDAKLRAE